MAFTAVNLETGQYFGIPYIVRPDGTAWWAGENSYFIDWSRDLRKDAVEGYKDTWEHYGYGVPKGMMELVTGNEHHARMLRLSDEMVHKMLFEGGMQP